MQSCIRCTRFLHSCFLILVIVTKSIYISGINVMPDAKVTELKTQLMLTSLSDL